MRYSKYLLLFFGLLFHSVIAFSNTNKLTNTAVNIRYFETSKEVSLQNAIQQFSTNNCKKVATNFINAGLVQELIWIHLRIQKTIEQSFIVLDNSRLNRIQSYFVLNNQISDSNVTGDYFPFATRKLNYPNFVFAIPQTKDSFCDAYFLIDQRGSTLQLPIEISSRDELNSKSQQDVLVTGIKMGILSIAFFFGLFLFINTLSRIYLFYSLYVFISAVWIWSTDGYGFQYLWLNFPELNNRIEASFGVLYSFIFAANVLQFTRSYQNRKSITHTVLKWLMYFFFVWGLLPLFPFISIRYDKGTPFFLYLFFTLNITGVVLMLLYFKSIINNGRKAVLFYFLAVINTLFFSVIVVCYNLGIFNTPFSSSTLVSTGMIIDIIFMTLGLTYQFNQYKKDKEAILIEYVEQQKSMNAKILATQEEERIRISREMHDDIGAGLTHITLMSEAAKNKKNNEPELNNIAIIGRKLVDSLSEIIWSLQPQNNNLEQLFNYLREHLNELLEYSNIDYKISLPEHFTNKDISSSVNRNIILVCKEAVNNAVKYSQATEINIVAIILENNIEFVIADNGIGFDVKTNKSGNGLRNIYFRSKEMNSNLKIESSNEKGTIVYFNVNI